MRAVFAVPGDLAAPTGGYEYARRVLQALPGLQYLKLPDGFPYPDARALDETARLLASVPSDHVLLVDGLAFGALPVRCVDGVSAEIVALVHHPLCQESGMSDAQAALFRESERLALSRARSVITTSASTAETVAALFDVPAGRITVAEPGTDRVPRAARRGQPPQLLGVGAISPRKAYSTLVEALAGLADLDWTLIIAGDTGRNPEAAAALRSAIAASPIAARMTLAGAVSPDALNALYANANIFVSASLHEGYGMAAATALAHGLPIVAASAGALVDTIPPAARSSCAPGDVAGLRQALRDMLTDARLRERCAEASWAAGLGLATWADTAAGIASQLHPRHSEIRSIQPI